MLLPSCTHSGAGAGDTDRGKLPPRNKCVCTNCTSTLTVTQRDTSPYAYENVLLRYKCTPLWDNWPLINIVLIDFVDVEAFRF